MEKITFEQARLSEPAADEIVGMLNYALRSKEMAVPFSLGIKVDMAHAVMLAEENILKKDDAAAILSKLKELDSKKFDELNLDPRRGGPYAQVEGYLIDHLGPGIGGRLHTGRSRIDRNAAVSRMTSRSSALAVLKSLVSFKKTLLDLAIKHVDTIMPGYTHFQHAQPWTFGHYLSSYFDRLDRDFCRLRAAYTRTNLSPLGTAALAGTSWPVNRERTAMLLGFDNIIRNAKDAGEFCKDYDMELASTFAMLMCTVGHLTNELYLWHSYEFGMVELADSYSATSSLMPQKKNPQAFDILKGMAGYVVGLPAVEFSKHRMCTSSDLDATSAPSTVSGTAQIVTSSLRLFAGTLRTLNVNKDVMKQRAGENWATVVHLADELTRKEGLSFRQAHHVCGFLVRLATTQGKKPLEANGEMLDQAAEQILGRRLGLGDKFVQKALDPESFINTRVSKGSVNPEDVRRVFMEQERELAEKEEWLVKTRQGLTEADKLLQNEVRKRISSEDIS